MTLATWSILNGVAMIILPTDGGSVPGRWLGFGYLHLFGVSSTVWCLLALLLFWAWFTATRPGIAIRATGSNEKSALARLKRSRNAPATFGVIV